MGVTPIFLKASSSAVVQVHLRVWNSSAALQQLQQQQAGREGSLARGAGAGAGRPACHACMLWQWACHDRAAQSWEAALSAECYQ